MTCDSIRNEGNGKPNLPEADPFPEGLSSDVPASDYADDPQTTAIAEAARRLMSLRDHWLNPPELVEWV